MSDLRTELVAKVLNQWNDVKVPEKETETTFAKEVFQYILANPYSSVREIQSGMNTDKPLHGLMSCMYSKKILGRIEKEFEDYRGIGKKTYYKYYALVDEYPSAKPGRKANKLKVHKVAKPKTKAKDKAPKDLVINVDIPRMKRIATPTFNPHTFVNGLNIHDAKEVYLLLKEIFE